MQRPANNAVDRTTVAAIAVTCYFAAVLIHEALGHAGITALLGGRVVQITSAACDCDVSALSPWAARVVFAGGCIANAFTGGLVLALRCLVRLEHAATRYALWLFGHVSLFVATGYLMVFPFLPAGDWHDFVGGLAPPLVWQLALTVLGVAGYATTMWHAQRSLSEFLGTDPLERRVRARDLTLLPYIVGGVVETLSAVIGGGGILVLISAAPATFGGTIGLALAGHRAGTTRGAGNVVRAPIPRAPVVLGVGLAALVVQLFWLGPGLLRR